MLNPVNNTLNHWHHPATHTEAPAATRQKRSPEQSRTEGAGIDFSGASANDRSRNRSGTLDSLGGGRLL